MRNTPESEIDSAPHRELALKTARESMVLLKNDGVLPLAISVKKILVVGPLAESVAGAARQLQRHGLARSDCAGRNSQAVPGGAGLLSCREQISCDRKS